MTEYVNLPLPTYAVVRPEPGQSAEIVELVRRWHDETHPGVFAFCTDHPCAEIVRVVW